MVERELELLMGDGLVMHDHGLHLLKVEPVAVARVAVGAEVRTLDADPVGIALDVRLPVVRRKRRRAVRTRAGHPSTNTAANGLPRPPRRRLPRPRRFLVHQVPLGTRRVENPTRRLRVSLLRHAVSRLGSRVRSRACRGDGGDRNDQRCHDEQHFFICLLVVGTAYPLRARLRGEGN